MKNTLILAFASMIIGGIAYYALTKPMFPKTKKLTPSVQPAAAKKLYTENEIRLKIAREQEQDYFITNWRKLIIVEGNTQANGLRGFDNIPIRVKNESAYAIDQAIVEVEIMCGFFSNKLCHQEELIINDVPANSEKSIKYSYTERGQYLNVRLIGYSCSELNAGYDPKEGN